MKWRSRCLPRPSPSSPRFLPLLLLTGACGEFIRALPIAVAVALSVSFVVAMMLTPMINGFFIKKGLHDPSAEQKEQEAHGTGLHAALLQQHHCLGDAAPEEGTDCRLSSVLSQESESCLLFASSSSRWRNATSSSWTSGCPKGRALKPRTRRCGASRPF